MVLSVVYKEQLYFAIEKRGNNPKFDKNGLWCLPCGYLDWNETGLDAIKRELWEEIGFDITKIKIDYLKFAFLNQPWFVKTDPTENKQNITLRYGIKAFVEELPVLIPNNDCEEDEIADAKWVALNEIKNYDFAFNHDQVIQEFVFLSRKNIELYPSL